MNKSEGYVLAVCLSAKRGTPKTDRGKGFLVQNFGLKGDAHAGLNDRQVSILLEQYVEPVARQLGRKPAAGSFAENLLVGGLAKESLGKGTVLRIGEAIVEITAVGKEDAVKHTYSYEGYRLLAEKGLFGRVLKSGTVRAGAAVITLDK